jgi:hypothetical protein
MCCISGGGGRKPMLSKNDFRHCDLFSIFFCHFQIVLDHHLLATSVEINCGSVEINCGIKVNEGKW